MSGSHCDKTDMTLAQHCCLHHHNHHYIIITLITIKVGLIACSNYFGNIVGYHPNSPVFCVYVQSACKS